MEANIYIYINVEYIWMEQEIVAESCEKGNSNLGYKQCGKFFYRL